MSGVRQRHKTFLPNSNTKPTNLNRADRLRFDCRFGRLETPNTPFKLCGAWSGPLLFDTKPQLPRRPHRQSSVAHHSLLSTSKWLPSRTCSRMCVVKEIMPQATSRARTSDGGRFSSDLHGRPWDLLSPELGGVKPSFDQTPSKNPRSRTGLVWVTRTVLNQIQFSPTTEYIPW